MTSLMGLFINYVTHFGGGGGLVIVLRIATEGGGVLAVVYITLRCIDVTPHAIFS